LRQTATPTLRPLFMTQILRKLFHFPLVKIIIGYALCFGFIAMMQRLVLKPLLNAAIENADAADSLRYFISIFLLLGIYYCFTRFYERRDCAELRLENWKMEILGGVILGFGCISLSILILFLLGSYHIIDISFDHYSIKLFTVLMLAAMLEDLITRAMALRIAEQWLGSYFALGIISLEELLHLFNPNVTVDFYSIFLFLLWGFSLGTLFIYSKRMWLPFAFHVGWNFAQPFYGSNLTGVEDMGKIIQSRFDGPEWITGGAMGIENSVFTSCILLAVGITFLYMSIKKRKIVKGMSLHNRVSVFGT
jgi:membrane protease YdiL (CAAX protease family)